MPHQIFQDSFSNYQREQYEEINLIKNEFDLKGNTLLPHINILPFATCITNHSGQFIDTNQKYEKLTGYTKKELIGNHITKVIRNLTKKEVDIFYQNFLNDGARHRKKFIIKTKTGDILSVISNASKILDKGITKKITFVANITDWDKTRIKILNKSQEINNNLEIQRRALEVAMHDIKNYVGNITLSSEMLMDEIHNVSHQNYLNLINKNSKAIDDHISELSRIVRIENGDYLIEKEKFDIKKILNNTIEEFQREIKQKQLQIQTNYENSKPLFVYSDVFCFTIALKNIIKNAIEASPRSKTITIRIKDESSLSISIHNHGAIPVEIQDKFFLKYVSGKLKQNGNTKKNTGLGTYIAKKMIDQMDGDISFTTDLDRGTTINIDLPADIQ